MLRPTFVLCCTLTFFLTSCQRAPKLPVTDTSVDPLSVTVPQDPYPGQIARFLAGMPGPGDSPFHELELQTEWIEHRRDLDRAWSKLEETGLPAMRAFGKQELSTPSIARAPVFYPFSGPDTLMLTVFFPANAAYVMVGLEPAGTLPSPKQLSRKNLGQYLAGVRATLASELTRSFFITRQMDRQFRGQVTDGLILPIMELLVRSHHTILGFLYIRLNDKGEVIGRAADYKAPSKIGNKGVEIEFRSANDQLIHKLFYFSVNLSDERLRDNQPFLAFLSSLPPTASLLKATSYMLHKPEFSIVRDELLSHSLAVLQDDSGIPYHYFAGDTWSLQLYGTYTRPYGSFRWLEQADLRTAYLSSGPKPLNFRIGYGYGKVPSNLLLARRSASSSASRHPPLSSTRHE
jgi:hypothetical protein